MVPAMCSQDDGWKEENGTAETVQSWDSVSYSGSRHSGASDEGNEDGSQVYTGDVGPVHEACAKVSVPLVNGEAREVAEKFVENWILKYGVPDVFHTDQGTNFGSTLMAEVCKLLKIDKTRTSPYHPQGNGQIERHNRVVADVLSKYCAENPRTWDTMLPYANFVYNTTVHRTTGATPFALVFGQECQYLVDLFFPKPHELTQTEFVEDLDRQFRDAHSNARELLGMNQKRQKDRFHKEV